MANATSSTVPGSMTGRGNAQADTVDPYGPWGTGQAVPATQTITAVNFRHVQPFAVQPAGTTGTLSEYADMFIGLTYGSPPVLELAWSSGYNPWGVITPGDAAIFTTIHPDVGGSVVHTVEWLVTFHDTAGHEVNAVQVNGVKNTATGCNLTMRCGTDPGTSYIIFENAAATKVYLAMGPVYSDHIWAYSTMIFQGSSLVVGNAALTTTATDGFLYLPSCAGAPTGAPATQTGTVACVVDTADSKLYAYVGGSWKSVTLA